VIVVHKFYSFSKETNILLITLNWHGVESVVILAILINKSNTFLYTFYQLTNNCKSSRFLTDTIQIMKKSTRSFSVRNWDWLSTKTLWKKTKDWSKVYWKWCTRWVRILRRLFETCPKFLFKTSRTTATKCVQQSTGASRRFEALKTLRNFWTIILKDFPKNLAAPRILIIREWNECSLQILVIFWETGLLSR